MTENTSRTAAATAKRMRASEEKLATKLRSRGWVCFSPDDRPVAVATMVQAAVAGQEVPGREITLKFPKIDAAQAAAITEAMNKAMAAVRGRRLT